MSYITCEETFSLQMLIQLDLISNLWKIAALWNSTGLKRFRKKTIGRYFVEESQSPNENTTILTSVKYERNVTLFLSWDDFSSYCDNRYSCDRGRTHRFGYALFTRVNKHGRMNKSRKQNTEKQTERIDERLMVRVQWFSRPSFVLKSKGLASWRAVLRGRCEIFCLSAKGNKKLFLRVSHAVVFCVNAGMFHA